MEAVNTGRRFLDLYNAKQKKANRKSQKGGAGGGNFVETSTGDLTPSRFLTHHAKERMMQRGVSQQDAIKGTKKSGAIIAANGAVKTVIPEAWIARDKKKHQSDKKGRKPEYKSPLIPSPTNLPEGHSRSDIKLEQTTTLRLVLGKKHTNMQKLIQMQKGPAVRYQVDGTTINLWGPESSVDNMVNEIDLLAKEANEKALGMFGPPVPDGNISDGQTRRRIVVADIAMGHVYGKEGRNIAKLREDHTAALINFDRKTGAMHVWGEPSQVDEICDAVAKTTKMARNDVRRRNAMRRAVGKTSYNRKMQDFEADMKAFAKKSTSGQDVNVITDKQQGRKNEKEKEVKSRQSVKQQKQAGRSKKAIQRDKDIRAARKQRQQI